MSIEAAIVTLLGPLVANRLWWDVPPDGFDHRTAFVLAQQVGGVERWYIDQPTAPSHRNSRVQFNVYAPTRLSASALIEQIGTTLRESGWVVEVLGAPVSEYESGLKLYGSRQDFGIWHPVSP